MGLHTRFRQLSGCVLLISATVFAGKDYKPEVIMLGIGPKNPGFDESKYPHVTVVYTPKLESQAEMNETGKAAAHALGALASGGSGNVQETVKGEPAWLAQWWNEAIGPNWAMVFDKNGVGAWVGKLKPQRGDLMDTEGEGKKDELKDVLKYLMKKEKTIDVDDGKEFEADDEEALLEARIQDFEVTDAEGNTASITEYISTGKTTMVVFFQIPSDVNLQNTGEQVEKAKDKGSFWKGMANNTSKVVFRQVFDAIEDDIFDHEVEYEEK